MRIAIDVLGTLKGRRGDDIANAIIKLQAAGHECVIWSSEYSYTLEAKKMYGLECETMSKRTKGDYDYEEKDYFDVAIEDDHGQTYLAARQFAFVDELPRRGTDAIVEFILNKGNTQGVFDE